MIEMKPFTDGEYNDYPGAEDFKDGSRPMTGEFNIGGKGHVLIAGSGAFQIVSEEAECYEIKMSEAINVLFKLQPETEQGLFDSLIVNGSIIKY